MALQLTDQGIIERSKSMPAFPRVVTEILATLDDDGATVGALVHHVERDPVITARVLSIANSAAMAGHSGSDVRDVRKAVSLIGLQKIREITLAVSLAEFAHGCRMASYFWEHSVAVGICALEVGRFTHQPSDYALVAGLLHDIGQLWMAHFHPLEFQMVRSAASSGNQGINEIEQRYFGVDHCHIGRLLATHWGLPPSVIDAIYFHHDPDQGLGESLVAITHVAEVLSNALDLTGRDGNMVANMSAAACEKLEIDWSQDLGPLFGRIEARTEYACRVFR